jgi:hypothetical protein
MSDSDGHSLFGNAESLYDDREKELAKLDPAWAKVVLYFRTGCHFGHNVGEIRARGLVKIHAAIEVYRVRFDGGDTLSLLHAIAVCAQENLPLPTWLAKAYRERLDSFLKPGGETNLDEVFCSDSLPTDTKKKAAQARQDWKLGGQIYAAVWQVAVDDKAITSLDAAVTAALKLAKYGVGKTKAKELFSMIDKSQAEHLKSQSEHQQEKSFSRFLELRRKPKT